MKKMKYKKNLFARILFSTLPFLFFTILIIISVITYINIMDFRKLFNSNTEMLMNIVAKDSEYALLTNNLDNFSKMADQLTSNKQIEYIQMFNVEGRKIFMKLPDGINSIPQISDSLISKMKETSDIQTLNSMTGIPYIFDYYIPVYVETSGIASEELFIESSQSSEKEYAGFIHIGVNVSDNYRIIGKSIWISSIILIISTLIFIFLLRALYSKVTFPIKLINKRLDYILSGKANLSQRVEIDTDVEYHGLVENFNKLLSMLFNITSEIANVSTNLSEHIELLTSSSEELTASSEEITSTIQQITNNSGEQARMIDEIATNSNITVNNIQKSVKKTDENEKFSSNILSISMSGKSLAKNAVDKIDNLRSSSQKLYTIINDVNEKQSRISSITDTIEAITKRTNILSLNASIEAARAGEYGRGFQVVAEEIRKLAEDSKNSTKNISIILKQINDSALKASQETKNTSKGVKLIDDEVKKVAHEFDSILEQVNGINSIAGILSTSSGEQTQIAKNMSSGMQVSNKQIQDTLQELKEINESIRQKTSATQSITEASETLKELSEKLGLLVKKFII